jgi:hypothetical protein
MNDQFVMNGELRLASNGFLCLATKVVVHYAGKQKIGKSVHFVWADNLAPSSLPYAAFVAFPLISRGD